VFLVFSKCLLQFFKRFDCEKPKTYLEVLQLTDEDTPEDSFLVNKLVADTKKEQILFRNTLESVKKKQPSHVVFFDRSLRVSAVLE